MDISAPTLKSNATSWSNWLMKSMLVYLSNRSISYILFIKDTTTKTPGWLLIWNGLMHVSGPTFASTALVKSIFLVTVPVSCVRSLLDISKKNIWFCLPVVTEETRIRWIQTQNSAEALFSKIKEVVNSGVYKAEEALHQLTSLVGGYKRTECKETKDAFETSAETAEDMINKAREKLDEKVKVGEEKMKSELWFGKKKIFCVVDNFEMCIICIISFLLTPP